jgi:hypothetical protein
LATATAASGPRADDRGARSSARANRWADLRPRLVSALAMLVVGAVAVWHGGMLFAELAVICTGLMMWELARMTGARGMTPRSCWVFWPRRCWR